MHERHADGGKIDAVYDAFGDKKDVVFKDDHTWGSQALSNDIERRLGQHEQAGCYGPGTATVTEVQGGKTSREISEHLRIQEITNGVPARESNAVSNRVDPIGPKRQYLLSPKP